jgi:hypothetical protein
MNTDTEINQEVSQESLKDIISSLGEHGEYKEQALKFLELTNTTFKAEYLKTDKYFSDDTEERDIYQCTLTRGERSYTFNFGQSLNESGLLLYHSDGTRTRHKGFKVPENLRKKYISDPIKGIATIKRWFKWEHFNLSGLKVRFSKPGPYDILACLQKYDPGTFKDFCQEYGYNEDSRTAERVYKGVVEEWQNLERLYPDDEIRALQEVN